MSFTAIHRSVGAEPGPITDELLNAAVAMGAVESSDLDWKSALPPAKGIANTDFPKDIAAMANSGGGIIVYGVRESQKAATERVDVGSLDEAYERTLRSAAITAISPPLFGLEIHRIGDVGRRAIVVEIPASVDGPHLIYRGEYFGAPVRNDSDTIWMKERQIEAMYRARFDERRHATEALDNLYADAMSGHNCDERAWFIAVAHPRLPRTTGRLTRDEARDVIAKAAHLALSYTGRGGIHPLENVEKFNLRPGLRRWVAPAQTGERSMWKEAWLSIHHDGSVMLAASVGGHRVSQDAYLKGSEVRSTAIECAVVDLMSVARASSGLVGSNEYELRIGIRWTGKDPLIILTTDNYGSLYNGTSTPLHRYAPIESTIRAQSLDNDFHWQVYDIAQDCVNQGGIANVRLIHPPEQDE